MSKRPSEAELSGPNKAARQGDGTAAEEVSKPPSCYRMLRLARGAVLVSDTKSAATCACCE